jgi:hypothetical protein
MTLLSLSGASVDYFLAALVMITITMVGAYFGAGNWLEQ